MQNGAGIDYRHDMADPTHPNDLGYQKMADKWYEAIVGLPILNKETAEFIKRSYRYILGREADIDGLNYWNHSLQTSTAASIVIQFFESDEYISRDLDLDSYLTILYQTLLNREPDEEGFAYWLDLLDSGDLTIAEVMINFFYSKEFHDLSSSFDLQAISDEEKRYILVSEKPK